MKTEDVAWARLREHASAQLPAGFPDRVLRAARMSAAAVPSFFSQFAIGAATAGVCLLIVAFFYGRTAGAENDQNLASWQEIAADADDLAQGL